MRPIVYFSILVLGACYCAEAFSGSAFIRENTSCCCGRHHRRTVDGHSSASAIRHDGRSEDTAVSLQVSDVSDTDSEQSSYVSSRRSQSIGSGGSLAAFSFAPLAALASGGKDEMEMVDLPPVWIPVVFGISLLVGVAVLTGSLSSVMDEEAALGMQSGARAKKEIERSQSSYFKKRVQFGFHAALVTKTGHFVLSASHCECAL